MLSWLIAIVGFVVFASVHSFLASHTFKRKLLRRFPTLRAWYRVSYNLFALITFFVWSMFLPVSRQVIYRIPFPYIIITFLVQATAIVAIWQTIHLFGSDRFIGTEQLLRYFKYREIPDFYDENSRGTLIRSGLYNYVRHPLYTLSLIILACWPVMTNWLVIIIILCALYFWIGSIFEERKLVERFGDAYKEYQRQVPRMIPHPFRLRSASRSRLSKDRTTGDISR